MGCCFAPLTSIGPPPFFSLLQAGVLLYYFACAGPGEQTHTNKTGTHVAHSMGAGLALIRYALAGDNGIFARHGSETVEDKLKALAELDFQQGKLCA